MKKMLAKAIALSVIMGGMSFVANDAQAAVKVDTDIHGWMNTRPGRYELVEKKDINGIESKADAAQKTADQAKKAVKKEEAERKDADKKIQGRIDKVEADSKAAVKKEEAERKDADKKIQGRIDKVEADSKAADAEQDKKIAANKTAIENEATARKNADAELDNKITAEETARKAADAELDNKITAEETARKAADDQLQKNIDAEAKAREDADTELDGKITTEKNERIAEDERIEAKFDGEVARLDSRIDKLDKKIEKVGAMAAAIANLHTMGYDPAAPTEIAVGVGQYRDKTGVALGAFHYPNRDFMLSFSVSTAGDEYMGGIGATWKFGRKTPEEMRQAEHEKAVKAKVAKAEAAKKAAKDARVAAQQQRHAEMLAARTAK